MTAEAGDRPLRVVVAGSGFVVPYHLAGWQAVAGVTVEAIVARNIEAGSALAQRFGIAEVDADLAGTLDRLQPDILDICTPASVHAEQARLAAGRGIHFMCQKPLADSLAGAAAIVASARTAGIRAMVHENFRFRPWYRRLAALVRDGAVGRPYYLRSDQRMPGTVTTAAHPETPWSLARQPQFATQEPLLILESMIHQVDVARMLLGDPETVYARARRVSPHIRGEDLGFLHLAFPGADAFLERSYAARGHPPPPAVTELVTVEGEAGALFVERNGTVRAVVDTPAGRREWSEATASESAYAASYAAAISHFVDGLRSGARFETDIADNYTTLAATLAAYESIRAGRPVPVPGLQVSSHSKGSTD